MDDALNQHPREEVGVRGTQTRLPNRGGDNSDRIRMAARRLAGERRKVGYLIEWQRFSLPRTLRFQSPTVATRRVRQ